MATGDTADIARRLRSVLPARWFPDEAPVLDAVLAGLAASWSWAMELLAWVRAQGRILTASGEGLDVVALDYLGEAVARRSGEDDARFRARIRREIFREKATRHALDETLTELTGYRPIIFEPARPANTGGWNSGALAYGAAGGWGTRTMHHQTLVTAYRPPGEGPPGISGFGSAPGALGPAGGAFALQSPEDLRRGITDEEIREAVVNTIAAGTVVWLRIRPWTEAAEARLDEDFILDVSRLS